MAVLPLEGLVVLEFSHTVMGPTCGVVLADLGADVIRVEPTPDGDRTRRLHGFATGFFARHGFAEIDGTPVSREVYEELLRSYDEGVAEFLDLDRVKPNTLGNHRMLLHL